MRTLAIALSTSLLLSVTPRAEEPTAAQKARIEELKKQIAEKKAEVTKLEAELAKLDPGNGDKLQGKWRTAETELAGAKSPKDKWIYLSWEFKDNYVTVVSPNVGDVPFRFLFDSSKAPTQIDFVHKNPKVSLSGIYKFDGEKLILCFRDGGGARPSKFDSNEGDGCWLLTLERVK